MDDRTLMYYVTAVDSAGQIWDPFWAFIPEWPVSEAGLVDLYADTREGSNLIVFEVAHRDVRCFQIFRKDVAESEWTLLSNMSPCTTYQCSHHEYVDSNIEAGISYTYRIGYLDLLYSEQSMGGLVADTIVVTNLSSEIENPSDSRLHPLFLSQSLQSGGDN